MRFLNKKWFLSFALVVTAAFIFGACDQVSLGAAQSQPTPLPTVTTGGVVTAEGRLVPVHFSALSFPMNGELGELLVSEGQAVSKGDVLARLGKREPLEASLSQAKLEQLAAQQDLDELNETVALARAKSQQAVVEAQQALSDAQNTLSDLDTEDFRDELDDLNLTLQDSQDELDDAQEELDKYKDLATDNATRENAQEAYDDAVEAHEDALYERDSKQNELDQAQAAVDLAAAQLDDARQKLEDLQDGPDPADLALAQARLDNAAAQVTAAQRALDNMDLVAPYSGMILDLDDLEPGESVAVGRTVATLADVSTWLVETRDLTELDVVELSAGQEVRVVPDALPDLVLAGEVESIDRLFTERSGDILYTVRIRLNEADERLRWGMTVTVTFEP